MHSVNKVLEMGIIHINWRILGFTALPNLRIHYLFILELTLLFSFRLSVSFVG